MQVVYTPEGVEPIRYDFEPYDLTNAEASAIEKLTGMLFEQWRTQLTKGSVTALHAFLWVMRRRGDPKCRPEQVVFRMNEIEFDFTDDERRVLVASLRYDVANNDDLSPVERQQRAETADAIEAELPDPSQEQDDAAEKSAREQRAAAEVPVPKAD